MTDEVKAAIEADIKLYKSQLRKFADEYLIPVIINPGV